MRRGLWQQRELVAALACALVLAGVLFAPALTKLQGCIVGHDFSEQYSGAWVNQWATQSLVRGHRFPFQVDNVATADGSVIYALSLTTALLSIPFFFVLNAAGVFNLAMVLNFLLAFGASFLLLRRVAGDRWSAFPGALAFSLSPFLLDHFAYGPLEGTAVGFIPLALWGVERFDGQRLWHHLVRGVLLALSFAANPYYGFFTFIAAGYLMLTRGDAPRKLRVRRAAAALALGSLLITPLAWAMDHSFTHPRSLTPARADRDSSGFHEQYITRHGVRDVASLVLPTRRYHSRFLVHGVYLGVPLLMACGLAFVRVRGSRRWFWMGLVFLLLSLGGSLKLGGQVLELGGHAVPLPFRWLLLHLPPFSAVTHPFRALPLVLLGAGAMIALLFARAGDRNSRALPMTVDGSIAEPSAPLARRDDEVVLVRTSRRRNAVSGVEGRRDDINSCGKRSRVFMVLFCLVLTGDYLWGYARQAPLPTAPYRVPAFHQQLARTEGQFGVLDMPAAGSDFLVGQYLLYQLRHRKLVPFDLDRGLFGPDAPDAARDFVAGLALSPQDYNDPRDWQAEAQRFQCKLRNCDGVAALVKLNYRHLALHLTPHAGFNRKLETCLRRCLPAPVHRDAQVVAFRLTPKATRPTP